MIAWKKNGAAHTFTEGPFVARTSPKGDNRWNWTIHTDGNEAEAASGIASSLGAAKTACENFVKRSGRV